jgi:cysteine desulfurase
MNADRLIFTSGGTEANNLIVRGRAGSKPGQVIVSAIEHPSVLAAAELAAAGQDVVRLPVNPQGVTELGELAKLLATPTRLVSIMLGNNETGVLQPVSVAAAICRSAGVAIHTDAVQCAGKIPIRFGELGVDALTISAHKFHGPVGIGALLVSHDLALEPILGGGFQQSGLRPGTEPVALAVGMHRALQLWEREQELRATRVRDLRDRFELQLRAACPEILVHGAAVPRLPHTSCIAFPGLDRQALVMALDRQQIACSTGSACASGSSEPSPVLLAMGLSATVVEGSVRFSFSALTTDREVVESVNRIANVVNDLRKHIISRRAASSPPNSPLAPV